MSLAISHSMPPRRGVKRLTDRQQEICSLVKSGMSYGQIAGEMNIKIGTVKTHLKLAFQNLGITSLEELDKVLPDGGADGNNGVDTAPLSLSEEERNERVSALTSTQFKVCQLAADGDDNETIRIKLRITRGTVKVHMRAAFRTLGIRKRTELLFFFTPSEISAAEDISFSDDLDRNVLIGVADGKTDPEIAESNGLSVSQVQARVKRMVGQIDGRNRTDLAAWWKFRNEVDRDNLN